MMPPGNTPSPPRILASRIRRTLTGPMWHGPAVMELLRSVEAREAAARPVPRAHTIWELVLHMTTWATVARERLDGLQHGDIPAERDWPQPPGTPTETAWLNDCQALSDAYEAFASAVRKLDDEALQARVPGTKYTVETMASGVVEHGVYHGGQIAIMLKAIRPDTP